MSEETDVLAALKQWGEMAYEGDPIVDVLLNDISRAVDRIQGLEDVLEEKRLAVNGLRSALSTSQARLSEAVKVLEEAAMYLDGYPEYHDSGMGCGLEDRNITDRYEAMRHGWDSAMDRTYIEHVNPAYEAIKAFLATLGEENHGG